ncbi:FMN-binding protein [Melioribacter sp. OK-6-Me]|uniref:FMN-binding protein n=1 Tax=unclassified Melioribacter TaxID=2627329 RepID=UPI003EDB1A11
MNNSIKMIIVLTSIALISGAVLAGVSNWAAPHIEANRLAETEAAIYLVQSSAKSYKKIETKFAEIYQVFDANGNPLGYSIVAEGNGFQGKIRMMLGVDSTLTKITAIEILEQVETPGLGSRIADDDFKNQFKNLIAQPSVNWVKGRNPEKPNEIQAITGATISSKSVCAIINDVLQKARIEKQANKL